MENTNSITPLKRGRKASMNGSTVSARKQVRAARPASKVASNGARQPIAQENGAGAIQPALAAAPAPEAVDARASTAAEKLSGQFALGRPGEFVPGDLIDTAKMVARQARRKPGAV